MPGRQSFDDMIAAFRAIRTLGWITLSVATLTLHSDEVTNPFCYLRLRPDATLALTD